MIWKSNRPYWTRLRPKYCALRVTGRSSMPRSVMLKRRIASGLPFRRGRVPDRWSIVPQSLELIESSGFGVEHVNHEVHEIDEDPASARLALDMMSLDAESGQALQNGIGHAADVGVGGSRRDHEEVGGVGQPP